MRKRRFAFLVSGTALSILAGCSQPSERTQQDLVIEGRSIFSTTCAACHGTDLQGTAAGPSFLDPIYLPDHHPDASFYAAVENGVVPHHWNFGPMPPQQGISREDVEAIIAFVRSEQEAADVEPEPSPSD